MPQVDFTQLGVASAVVGILLWLISKITARDPDLVPRSVVDALKERITQAEADKKTLAAQNETLAKALAASNLQVQTALEIASKLVGEEDES